MAIKWPPIPKVVRGAGGPIKIRVVDKPNGKGEEAWGTWEAEKRTIRLAKKSSPAHRWKVLFHELTHAAMDDAGVCNLLTADGEEAICDAIGTARFQEMRGQLGMDE